MRENLSKKWCLSDTVKLILFDIKSQMERQDSMLHNPLTQEEKQRNKRFFKILGLSRTPKKDRKRKGEIASKGDGLKYIFSFTHQSKKINIRSSRIRSFLSQQTFAWQGNPWSSKTK